MSILNKIKESSPDYLKQLIQILTPLEYVEYVCKMLLVLDFRKVEMCLLLGTILNILIMLSGLIFNIGIKTSGLVISCICSCGIYLGFTAFRKSKAKTTVTNYEIGEVSVKKLDIADFEIPDPLKRYMNDGVGEVRQDISNTPLNSMVQTSSVVADNVVEFESSVSKSVELKPSIVDDLDLSNFNYEDYFKEN